MKIMHTYCLNYNLGDYALGIGVKNIFRNLFNVSLFADTNIQGQKFDDYFINILNEKYDLLIIGGGGIIHGAHWPQGWFWLIEKKNLKKIKIPFIIYGVGYNYFKDEKGIPKRGVEHLKETNKRAAFFSVRNDRSYERLLNQTGIAANVIADPGFWVPLDNNFDNRYKKKYIVVQLANDKPKNRFGSLKNRERFIKNIKNALRDVSNKYRIIFAPHVHDDIELCDQVASGIKNSEVINFSNYAFDKANSFLSVYQDAEMAIAMRGHGQIVPLGFGVPAISLENHDKHKGLMQEYGLSHLNVDVNDKEFTSKLKNTITAVLKNHHKIKVHIEKQNTQLFAATKNQLGEIKELSKYLK